MHPIRNVGVVGGGTAGYLAALGLRARCPGVDVTLIESSTIPVIGVGEATTPRLVSFLHGDHGLGLDIVDLHERVRPVWKVGVLYDWGRPGVAPFPWPFEYGELADSWHYEGSINLHNLGAELMNRARVPVVAALREPSNPDGGFVSLLREVPIAYHLDNGRFVGYLREQATRAGVHHADRVVVDAELTPDGAVESLRTDDGERLSFDLYVDCTGFRSLLLEQKLGSRFISFESSLLTDAAVMANVSHDGNVRPYTLAETMANGWCWNIAFEDDDHRGYVYASAFSSPEEAAAEMRRTNPRMGDWWSLRFRSGRHEDWWRGNVVALGNAYGFVEPLASTALHLLIGCIDVLTSAVLDPPDPADQTRISAHVGQAWDEVRGWLAVQYAVNRRYETPFWKACATDLDLGLGAERLARFKERAPLTSASRPTGRYFAEDYSYDVVLAGNQVDACWDPPERSPEDWRARSAQIRSLANRAITQSDALELVRTRRPDILTELATDPEGWIQQRRY